MEKKIHYKTSGVCSQFIDISVKDDVIQEVYFEGGCSGNLQGISLLLRGMEVEEAMERLEGIRCGSKNTSCPDQFVKALKEMKLKNE